MFPGSLLFMSWERGWGCLTLETSYSILTQYSISYPESSGSLASGWSPGDQPLAKEPEDSGYKTVQNLFKFKASDGHVTRVKEIPNTNMQ